MSKKAFLFGFAAAATATYFGKNWLSQLLDRSDNRQYETTPPEKNPSLLALRSNPLSVASIDDALRQGIEDCRVIDAIMGGLYGFLGKMDHEMDRRDLTGTQDSWCEEFASQTCQFMQVLALDGLQRYKKRVEKYQSRTS